MGAQLWRPQSVAFSRVPVSAALQPGQRERRARGRAAASSPPPPSRGAAGGGLPVAVLRGATRPLRVGSASSKGDGKSGGEWSLSPFLHLFSVEFLRFLPALLTGCCALRLLRWFSWRVLLPSERGAAFRSVVTTITIFIRISYFPLVLPGA